MVSESQQNVVFLHLESLSSPLLGKRSVNEDELAEVMAEEEQEGDNEVNKRDPYAFGLGKKVRTPPAGQKLLLVAKIECP